MIKHLILSILIILPVCLGLLVNSITPVYADVPWENLDISDLSTGFIFTSLLFLKI